MDAPSAPRSAGALDLSKVSALVVDADHYSVEMLAQILRGFGMKSQTVADSGEAAKRHLSQTCFDLVLIEATLPDMPGATVVEWLRRNDNPSMRHVPVIVLTASGQISTVLTARDSGANHVVRKPVSHSMLFDRIAWSATSDRGFVETPSYAGPDRRFKSQGPPGGVGRRATDLSAEIGDASEPNLSQFEIDSFMKPVRMSLE